MTTPKTIAVAAVAVALAVPGGIAVAAVAADEPVTPQQARAHLHEAVLASKQIVRGSKAEVAAVQTTRQAWPAAAAQLRAARYEAIQARYTPAFNRAWAKSYMAKRYGWGAGEHEALVTLWNHESEWVHTEENPTSGAYGIPQALPADKMASAGADWRTNPRTQIKWGLRYIEETYGSPSAAWGFWTANNWY